MDDGLEEFGQGVLIVTLLNLALCSILYIFLLVKSRFDYLSRIRHFHLIQLFSIVEIVCFMISVMLMDLVQFRLNFIVVFCSSLYGIVLFLSPFVIILYSSLTLFYSILLHFSHSEFLVFFGYKGHKNTIIWIVSIIMSAWFNPVNPFAFGIFIEKLNDFDKYVIINYSEIFMVLISAFSLSLKLFKFIKTNDKGSWFSVEVLQVVFVLLVKFIFRAESIIKIVTNNYHIVHQEDTDVMIICIDCLNEMLLLVFVPVYSVGIAHLLELRTHRQRRVVDHTKTKPYIVV